MTIWISVLQVSIIIAASLGFLASCDQVGPVDPPVDPEPLRSLMAPPRVKVGEPLPIVVRAVAPDGTTDTRETGSLTLTSDRSLSVQPLVHLKHGVGSAVTSAQAAGTMRFVADLGSGERLVVVADSFPSTHYDGRLPVASTIWDATSDRIIDEDLTLPAGAELTIQAGTRVLIGAGVNLIIHGNLNVEGTEEEPVVIMAHESTGPWGGIEIRNTTARIAYSFFMNGGADPTRTFGHSQSQPVLLAVEAEVVIENSVFMDNPGKALGAREARIAFADGLITRSDTGGEFHGSIIHVLRSHVLDIPSDDGIFVDDDNDGFYFAGAYPDSDEPSIVEHSFIITGKDDAIDHNQAILEVRHSWLEGFMHEGVAGSNGNSVLIFDTVVKDCEQGIEAGYGAPNVLVDHSVVIGNQVGLRFGDSYGTPSEGHMTVTNTIVYDNADNIYNFEPNIGAPVSDGISIRHTMTNDPDYDDCDQCITGVPLFDSTYFLVAGSPGAGSAEDGSDMGRVRQP